MTDLMAIQLKYDLPTLLAKILLLMIEHRLVTATMIEAEYDLTRNGKVAIARLRKRLEGHSIDINSRRELGYWISPEKREELAAALKSDIAA